ncbi:PAS domain S-box protein [Caulobacter sp. 17J65-9]|uniref:sensor histidine kinase n=1 Tax=Caulobacter sp. 17J65-9 TaxID=2709382 RepID=UPI0013C7FD21|nr:PAS domain S-box protein [Caulobacter sp. 17J65-9]NEX95068.1 PAS domain S-box protein [Caulobacter sp. 17J65-9]
MAERNAAVADEALLEAILRSATDFAIVATDLDGRVTFWNQGAERVLGWTADEMSGRPVEAMFTPQDRDAGVVAREMEQARVSGWAEDMRWHLRKDGQVFWAQGRLTPLRGPEDALIGYLKILRDRTQARTVAEARETSEAALRLSEARLRLALEAGRMAVWETDGALTTIIPTPEIGRLLGFPPGYLPSTAEIRSVYLPGESARIRAAAFAAMERKERFLQDEMRIRRKSDGAIRVLLIRVEAVYLPDGTPSRLLGVAIDITEQKRAEERQRLLLQEMSHRVKNTLAVVQAMVGLALRRAETLAEAEAALNVRLKALASAHDLLTAGSWEGADLAEVVSRATCAHGPAERFRIAGPPVRLSPDGALALSLALQELATNAVKYGALSTEGGQVEIGWTAAAERLELIWRERGGPAVAPPEAAGFGARLLERVVEHDLGGRILRRWEPGGLVCEIEAPLT